MKTVHDYVRLNQVQTTFKLNNKWDKLRFSEFAIDFETFYRKAKVRGKPRYTVAELGNHAYVHNPEFDAYLVGIGNENVTLVTTPAEVPWEYFFQLPWVSHNRAFDSAVYDRLVEFGVVPARPAGHRWFCSADMCAYFQFPRSLDDAVSAVSQHLDKKEYKPSKEVRTQMDGRKWDELAVGEKRRLVAYCGQDVALCSWLWVRIGRHWPDYERGVSELTHDLNRRGVQIDLAYLEDGFDRIQSELIVRKSGLPVLATSNLQVVRHLEEISPDDFPASTSKTDPMTVAWVLAHPGHPVTELLQEIWMARELTKVLGDLSKIKAEVGRGNTLYPRLVYFGASTGRWTSRGGLNTQTLKKGETHGVDVRRCFVPRPGKIFLTADFAQVEVRCYFFVATDFDSLELIRRGLNPYEAFARANLGYSNSKPLKEVDPKKYALVKASVLSLGYGVGARKFMETAEVMHGIKMGFQDARHQVKLFRDKYSLIVSTWKYYEGLMTGAETELRIELPIGYDRDDLKRRIYYRNLKTDKNGTTYRRMTEGQWKGNTRVHLYGGKIFQNVVQATARDVFADAWIRCEQGGFYPVMSIHDELVFEVPRNDLEKQIEQLTLILSTSPDWAPTLPLNIEVKVMEGYGK